MNIVELGRKPAVEIPLFNEASQEAEMNAKIKSFYNYGVEMVGQEIRADMYVEWQISPDEVVQCLDLMIRANIVTYRNIQETCAYIANHQWQFIVEQLQCRLNQQNPYYFYPNYPSGIPFPTYPNTYLMEHDFFKFPASSFYSTRLYPFWIEATLERMGEGKLYLCFPLSILRDMQGELLLLNRIAKPNDVAYLVLDNDAKYPFLETCSMIGKMSEAHRQDVLQLLSGFLPQQAQ